MSSKLEKAKRGSLKKWRTILKAYPDCEKMYGFGVGSVCAFCCIYYYYWGRCKCLLYPKICGTYESLFYRIYMKTEKKDKRGLKQMIQKMIREIKNAKEKK